MSYKHRIRSAYRNGADVRIQKCEGCSRFYDGHGDIDSMKSWGYEPPIKTEIEPSTFCPECREKAGETPDFKNNKLLQLKLGAARLHIPWGG